MSAVLFMICMLGCASCASVFGEEYREGKFNASLLTAAIGWLVGACLTMTYLVNE